jgi:lipopolysaccharide export LptBFGC system permease protein LptF
MQLHATAMVSVAAFFLILLFDFAEVGRRYPISTLPEALFAIKLSLLRTPSTFCEILNYVYFITAAFILWNLCRSQQMTVLKSIGRSPQQILYPFLSFAALVAGLWLFVLHPAGLYSELMYVRAISGGGDSSEINRNVWIDDCGNNQVIFIGGIRGNQIERLCIFDLGADSRIFAEQASAEGKVWILSNVTTVEKDRTENIETMEIPGRISTKLIKLLAKSPKKHDIYGLYTLYKIRKKDRVSIRLYELELHRLLANGFSFLLFALLAAVICFPVNRYRTKTDIALKVISSAIFLRFANNMFESSAHGDALPTQLAAWAPSLIFACIAVALLIRREA